jgi:hypothetical protein
MQGAWRRASFGSNKMPGFQGVRTGAVPHPPHSVVDSVQVSHVEGGERVEGGVAAGWCDLGPGVVTNHNLTGGVSRLDDSHEHRLLRPALPSCARRTTRRL